MQAIQYAFSCLKADEKKNNKLFEVKNPTRHCHPPFLVINCAATRRFLVNVVRWAINSVEEKASA